jgi:hypothetical protein
VKLSETALKIAFLGMRHEANDIIDYLAICFSVSISILVGVVAAIWIGLRVDALAGLLAGFGSYGVCTILCLSALLHRHHG